MSDLTLKDLEDFFPCTACKEPEHSERSCSWCWGRRQELGRIRAAVEAEREACAKVRWIEVACPADRCNAGEYEPCNIAGRPHPERFRAAIRQRGKGS